MPVRYLGIPLAAEKLKVTHYGPFIEKIIAYLNSWTSASLFYAGRAKLKLLSSKGDAQVLERDIAFRKVGQGLNLL